jgi:putative hydrolase of the HAD superfamily
VRLLTDLDALFVDAGGVLLLPRPGPLQVILAPWGRPSPHQLDRAHYQAMAAYDRATPSRRGAAYRQAFLDALGIPPERADALLAAAFSRGIAWDRPIADSVWALIRLSRQGLPIVVVSNTDRGDVARRLRDAGVCQVGPGPGAPVTAVIDSVVVGAAKPDPRIFALARQVLGGRAERILHIGDSIYHDVEGARAAGLAAVHFDPHRLCRRTDHPHLRRLSDLVVLRPAAGRPHGHHPTAPQGWTTGSARVSPTRAS